MPGLDGRRYERGPDGNLIVARSERLDVLAAIDIGTNSIRLEVVRVEQDSSVSTLSYQKEMVRLGEGEFDAGRLTPAAIERGALVCARFADMARGFVAGEILAFATSAVREAENREDFIERVRQEAGIEVRVISGPEEARLIYLGVVSGADLGDRRALFIDIGGGSTELILADAREYYELESLKLGSIRLTNRFMHGLKGPVSLDRFQQMKEYARAVAKPAVRHITRGGYEVMYGSAGTITNLAQVTAKRLGDNPSTMRNYVARFADLRDSVEMLCRMPLDERRSVPGLDPERADIVLGGAAVLMTAMEEAGADRLTISDRGLRHGIVVDRLLRHAGRPAPYAGETVRRRSILQLARACNFEEDHARHVAAMSLTLFDELGGLGMHNLDGRARELLEYAALLHDIGGFLSHSNHQRHAYYLIRNSDLLGFTDAEIAVMANVALYHRKSVPKRKHENLQSLSGPSRRIVAALAAILRVAEGLDRSHLGLARSIRIVPAHYPDRIILVVESDADCQLERWSVEANRDLFEQVFGMPLVLHVAPPQQLPEAAPRAALAS